MKYGIFEKETDNTCPIGVIVFLPLMVIVMAVYLFVGLTI